MSFKQWHDARPLVTAVLILFAGAATAVCLGQERPKNDQVKTRSLLDRRGVRGVTFVARWAFDEPVEFNGVKRQEAKEGYLIGLVVNLGPFVPRAGKPPLLYADQVQAVSYGSSLFKSTKVGYAIVQIPDLDLTKTKFWVGPSMRLRPQEIRESYDGARDRGLLFGPLSVESLRVASRVLTDKPIRSHEEVLKVLKEFLEKQKRGELELTIIPFEAKELETSQ
ncbi:MAG: hypothetical protein IIA33_02935 [Planctomycetes bacterium]|nr:hypothetical protein [Planctomycetota bacterium]